MPLSLDKSEEYGSGYSFILLDYDLFVGYL